MADVADQAAEIEARERDTALSTQLAEAERQRRIAESFRPNVADESLRCVECDELIGTERLRVMPRASRCTPCAEAAAARLREAR